jgi:hypothetical protein
LLGDRLRDLAPPVAHVHHREPGEAVHELLALLGPDPDALGPVDDELLVGEERMVLRLVRPEVPDRLRVGAHGLVSGKGEPLVMVSRHRSTTGGRIARC